MKLKACPFHTKKLKYLDTIKVTHLYHTICIWCGAQGPWSVWKIGAEEGWNKRG